MQSKATRPSYADVCAFAREAWQTPVQVTLAGLRAVEWSRARRTRAARRRGVVYIPVSKPYADEDAGVMLGLVAVYAVQAAA